MLTELEFAAAIRATAEWVKTPTTGTCSGDLARDAKGTATWATDPAAVSYCALGYLCKRTNLAGYAELHDTRYMELLPEGMPGLGGTDHIWGPWDAYQSAQRTRQKAAAEAHKATLIARLEAWANALEDTIATDAKEADRVANES